MAVTIPFLARFARAPQKSNQANATTENGNTVPNLPRPSTIFTEVKDETTDDQ